MRKVCIIAALVYIAGFSAGPIALVLAQGNITASQNNLDSHLASLRFESEKLMAKISQLNAKINKLYAQKSPNQKKISAYRKKIKEYQRKFWQNIQKENDIRAKAFQAVKQTSDLQQAVAGEIR